MDWARMRFLIKRLPEAKHNIQKAKSYAYRVTKPIAKITPSDTYNTDSVFNDVEAIEEAKAKYRAVCNELDALRAQAAPLIASLPDPLEQDAMRLRYLEGLSALEVSFRINYSVQHTFRILSRAEKKLA